MGRLEFQPIKMGRLKRSGPDRGAPRITPALWSYPCSERFGPAPEAPKGIYYTTSQLSTSYKTLRGLLYLKYKIIFGLEDKDANENKTAVFSFFTRAC